MYIPKLLSVIKHTIQKLSADHCQKWKTIQFCLCLIKHHAIRLKVCVHAFLNSALDDVNDPSTALLPRKQPLVSTGQGTGKAPELVRTLHNRKLSSSGTYWTLISWSYSLQISRYTVYLESFKIRLWEWHITTQRKYSTKKLNYTKQYFCMVTIIKPNSLLRIWQKEIQYTCNIAFILIPMN